MSPEKKKLLYIEDDLPNRQLVQFVLKKNSEIQFIEAETGEAGLLAAEEHLPDIIFLDLNLPDISGFEVLKKLKNTTSICNIPVIAVSGNSLPEDIERGLSAGFKNYLTKPININDLHKILEEILA